MVSQHLNDESVDGDEVVVPFDRSSLSFETDFQWLLYSQSVANSPI